MEQQMKWQFMSFNSLQVGQKFVNGSPILSSEPKFQFLIGRIEMHYISFLQRFYIRGSIPYRQDRNQLDLHQPVQQHQGFNSLQVGQKCGNYTANIADATPFQFLIGRIEIDNGNAFQDRRRRFQFLIGRIEMQVNDNLYRPTIWVSIPYRQDRNYQNLQMALDEIEGFNSLQVGQKFSLRYGLSRQKICVSIPYRQDRNLKKQALGSNQQLGFNSLQVGQKLYSY